MMVLRRMGRFGAAPLTTQAFNHVDGAIPVCVIGPAAALGRLLQFGS
jgi:hypothetical protein